MTRKYSKQDEKLIKDLMNTLYDRHQSLKGGSFFTEFVHGFTVPFKQFGHLLSLIPEVGPALASVVTPVAEALDTAVPGHRYANMSDLFSSKPIKGTGRGRPRKIPKEIKIDVNIEDPMKRDKVFTETAKQLIDEENKNVVGKRPRRGRPKKVKGGGIRDFLVKNINPKKYAIEQEKKQRIAADQIRDQVEWRAWRAKKASDASAPVVAPAPVVATAPVVGSGKRKSMKGGRKGIGQLFREGLKKTVELKKLGELEQAKNVKLLQHAETPVVGSGKRGRPKGSKNKK